LARRGSPKPFLPLLDGRSLFTLTWERARSLAGASRVLVVCGEEHAAWVRRQAPGLPKERIIREGQGRNTAASVALAAHWIRARQGDATMVVLPADHWIDPASSFRRTIRRALRAVRGSDALATIGVPARSPDPGFGWIETGGPSPTPGVRRVSRFIEKPAPPVARRLFRSRRFLWNAGIFVWRASSILRELALWEPEVERAAAAWAARGSASGRVPRRLMRRMPAMPIDRAVLERSSRVLVTRADFRWSDLGTWGALAEVLESLPIRISATGGQVMQDARRCVGFNPGGLTAFVGVEDLVAVRAQDVVLVCRRDAAQGVRGVAEAMRGRLRRHA
jgi:mannose-1-phosphate guanylyltransferase